MQGDCYTGRLVPRAGPVMLVCLAIAPVVQAQRERPEEPRPQPVVSPPRVIEVPGVELPEGTEVPEGGAVELVLAIDATGGAAVEECDASAAICERVREAIAGARFAPATRDGAPIPARIGMRFRLEVAEEPPADTTEDAPEDAAARAPQPSAPPDVSPSRAAVEESRTGFGVTAVVDRPPPGAMRLELEELREMPGAFGDPFRAIEALPGITPILSGLPYFYVRGAPPSGTIYVYDDIPLPALYHLGFGPAAVHPRMIGPLRLYTGVPPARFGRFIGGVIEAEGPGDPRDDDPHGEVELRLLDVTAMVQANVLGGRAAIAGRYGYPGLLLSIFSPEVDLAYWDYQLRFERPIGRHDSVEIVWLGSFDSLSAVTDDDPVPPGEEPDSTSLDLHFHRLELRLVRHLDDVQFGSALRLGYEESGLDDELSLSAFSVGPRMWLRADLGDATLRTGVEMIGVAGDLRVEEDEPPRPGEDPQGPGRNSVFARVAGRNMSSAWMELSLSPIDWLSLELGLRGDMWATGSTVEAALDPRLRAVVHASDAVDLHVAAGVARQPAVFFIPLPGLSEIALDRGLQTATQAEAGVSAELPLGFEVEAQAFVHHYSGLLFLDLFVEDDACSQLGVCSDVPFDPRVDGISYGGELFLRRDPSERLAGFVSYTLAWAEVDDVGGIDYSPSYDVRHVVNVAGRWDIGGGFSAGLRLHYRTGKPLTAFYLDVEDLALGHHEQRLPGFFRADAQLAYQWETSWGRMRLALEWFNLTFSEEAIDMECDEVGLPPPDGQCPIEHTPPIVAPNIGLRGTF